VEPRKSPEDETENGNGSANLNLSVASIAHLKKLADPERERSYRMSQAERLQRQTAQIGTIVRCAVTSKRSLNGRGAKNAVFFGVFPMFVPSLSWQNDRFYIKMRIVGTLFLSFRFSCRWNTIICHDRLRTSCKRYRETEACRAGLGSIRGVFEAIDKDGSGAFFVTKRNGLVCAMPFFLENRSFAETGSGRTCTKRVGNKAFFVVLFSRRARP
jgi:hypothetical protein